MYIHVQEPEIWLLLWLFVSNQGHEHDFKEDWGEQLVGKHKLALNILDLNSGDIDTLDTIPEDLSVGQVTQKENRLGSVNGTLTMYKRKIYIFNKSNFLHPPKWV